MLGSQEMAFVVGRSLSNSATLAVVKKLIWTNPVIGTLLIA